MVLRLAILLILRLILGITFPFLVIIIVSNSTYPSSHPSVLRRTLGYRYLLDALASLVSTFDQCWRPH